MNSYSRYRLHRKGIQSFMPFARDVAPALERASPSDEEIVRRVLDGNPAEFEALMRRFNERLFRIARSIVGSAIEAEDVVQQAYVSAYFHLSQFDGRASFATWLTRIAIHEAWGRARRNRSREKSFANDYEAAAPGEGESTPEAQASVREFVHLVEEACDALPEPYRVVFMMRGIEEMSTAETAECLEVSEEAVKVRFHRARALLRGRLHDGIGQATRSAFAFWMPAALA